MVGTDDHSRSPLDDVDHLARSPHRTTVVRLLAREDWTRRDLHEETGIPQPTLGRILGSFRDRNWLARNGDTYSLTLHGRLVAAHFEELLDVVETVQNLPNSADFGPLLDLGFETEWLARVDVTGANVGDADHDPYAHLRRGRESVKASDRIYELSPGPLPGMAELMADRLRAGELTLETVFQRDTFEAFVTDPENRSLIAEMLETGRFDLHLFDDTVPCYVARHGERAVFEVESVEGTSIAFLTTTETPIIEWIESVVDEYREGSERVTTGDLSDR